MEILPFLYMLFGFIVMFMVLYFIYEYLIIRWVSSKLKSNKKSQHTLPSNTYMRHVGLSCPDYWVNKGVGADGQQICVNEFNVPVNNPEVCYDTPGIKKFSEIKQYPIPPNQQQEVLKDRCQWVRQCGAKKNISASWLGVDEHC